MSQETVEETPVKSKNNRRAAPKMPSKSRLIPVLNNRLGSIQISAGRSDSGAFDGGRLINLVPGTNLISEEVWSIAKEQHSVQLLLELKIESTGSPEDADARVGQYFLVAGNPMDADNPLRDLNEEDALLFVSKTESLVLLKQLATQESSGQVLQAINHRIKLIEDPAQQVLRK